MRLYLLLASIAAATLLTASGAMASTPPSAGVEWAPSLEAAQRIAAEQKKLLLVHFWAPSCGPCTVVERQVLSQPRVGQAVSQEFVAVKINADEQPELARQFGVRAWPTDVFVTADGYAVHRCISPQNPEAYLRELTQATAAARIAAPAQIAASSPVEGAPAAGYSGQYDQPPPYDPSLAAPQRPGAGAGIPPAGQPWNAPQSLQQPPVSHQALPANPGPWPPAQQAWNQANDAGQAVEPSPSPAHQPPPAPQMVYNPQFGGPAAPAGQAASAAPPAVVHPNEVATASAQQPVVAMPSEPAPTPSVPAGNPPVGMEGFCPVTLVKEKKWIRGDVRWGAIHRGRTYLFLAKDKQEEFLKDPDKYSPILSGFDPVKYADQGILVPGRRQHGLFYGKEVYLFADEDAVNRFSAAPGRYTPLIRQAMLQGNGAPSGTVQR